MLFKLKSLIRLFPKMTGNIREEMTIEQVTIDSRETTKNSLFIPIEGDRFNGHDFLEQAIENGAIATLWNENKTLPDFVPENFPVFFVSNTTNALQQLAADYRKQVNPQVIGITGSNGKTTTKDILASILQTTYETHATKGNLNNDIGLPLTILSMPQTTEMLVVEMGMNDFNEIDRLTNIAQPDYAIITNIGESHIEHLGSREGIAKAKLEIANGLNQEGLLIIDGDESLLKNITHLHENVIKCGFGNHNKNIVSSVNLVEDGTTFELNNNTYKIPLYGKHHALNATFAIVISEVLGVSVSHIKQGLASVNQTAMRFQLLKSAYGATLVNDAYNASPTSMIGAINVIKQFAQYDEKVVVLGDILELGDHSEQLHLSVAEAIGKPITKLYTYGNNAKLITQYVKENEQLIKSKHFSTKDELITYLKDSLHEDTIVLFKASRGMAFESIIKDLM